MTWPKGPRDTTEFPAIEVEVSPSIREHLQEMCESDGHSWHEKSTSRFRTYRKMYERLGLLYRDGNTLRLSELGHDLCEAGIAAEGLIDDHLAALAARAAEVLSRYQFINPSDDAGELPPDSDVQPFLAIWSAMAALGDKLHWQEVNRVLTTVDYMGDVPLAIERIAAARQTLSDYAVATDEQLEEALGKEVVTDQPTARMAALFSLAGWGGRIIEKSNRSDGFRHFAEGARESWIQAILDTPPDFYETSDLEDWYRYYLGSARGGNAAAVVRVQPSIESLEGLLARLGSAVERTSLAFDQTTLVDLAAAYLSSQFLLFAGPSGTGKSTAARFLIGFFAPNSSRGQIDARRQLIGPEDVAGYYSLNGSYVRTGDLDGLLRLAGAAPTAPSPGLLVEEINLSPIEGYLGPLIHGLSAVSTERVVWPLHRSKDESDVPADLVIEPFPRLLGTVNVDATAMAPSPKVAARACTILMESSAETSLSSVIAHLKNHVQDPASFLDGDGKELVGDPLSIFDSNELDQAALESQLDSVLDLVRKAEGETEELRFSHRQLGQMTTFAAWYGELAKAFKSGGGQLAADPYRLGSESALLHFGLASLATVEFSVALRRLHASRDLLTDSPDVAVLGATLRSKVDRLWESAGVGGFSGRLLDFWDRLS